LLNFVRRTIDHFFPDLSDLIEESCIDTRRKASIKYSISEIVLAAVFLHTCKAGSRNSMNQDRSEPVFKKNYRELFGFRLPHMDTVNDVMKKLPEEMLERLRKKMIRCLLTKRVFHKYRFLGEYFVIALDATGIFTFEKSPYPNCPYKTSKTGKRTYHQPVLEAKLVTRNGFSISLCTEWIINEDGASKQDCEYKAGLRLMKKLKRDYPRLPMCIVLDGLYAKQPIMSQISQNNWKYIIVWKDKTMYAQQDKVQEHRDAGLTVKSTKEKYHNQIKKTIREYEHDPNEIKYKTESIWYARLVEIHKNLKKPEEEKRTKFVFMTNVKVTKDNVMELIEAGRLRWKIENEGFNIQKNHEYHLHHKMSRGNINAIKNYYLCLQIAHLLDQLILKCKNRPFSKNKTVKKLWEYFTSALRIMEDFCFPKSGKRYNYRFE